MNVSHIWKFALLAAILAIASPAWAGPKYPGDFTSDKKIAKLAAKVGTKKVAIEGKLPATKALLGKVKSGERAIRILHLGDSHIASDYITSRIRHRLQAEYGSSGRGFVHVAQRWGYGGRWLDKKEKGWLRDRIVDKDRAGRPFGFSGMSLESKKKGAKLRYRAEENEEIAIYYYTQPGGSAFEVRIDGKKVASIETNAATPATQSFRLQTKKYPMPKKAPKMPGPKGGRILEIVAKGKKVRIFGLSFDLAQPGLLYESVGPVGADAKVYLQLERTSLEQHLRIHRPDLVVLMVGGNDALKIRKKWTDPARVKKDHEDLIDVIKKTLPQSEVLLWAPMDAGDRKKGKVVSKAFLTEMRAMQREVAKAKGIAFWDTLEAMGGPGAIARWDKARVMNKDLVHPKKAAADLLGDLFADAFLGL